MIERAQAQLGAATWGDLLARRRVVSERHPFVGRRDEQEQFRLNYLYEVPQVLLYVLQGPAGIGKTALLTRYREIAAEHSGLTALVDRESLTLPREAAILQMMETLADQLAAVNTPLTSFREVYREYLQAVRTIDEDSAAPGRVWDLFGGASDPDAWSQRAWDTYFSRTLPVRRSALLRDPVGTLTERFVQDLNAWAVVRRIILCFDDWQQARQAPATPGSAQIDPETWLPALLSSGQLSTNIWSIVTTPSPPDSRWEPLASVTRTFVLQPLPTEEAVALLRSAPGRGAPPGGDTTPSNGQARPPLSDAAAAVMVERAQGNPLSLSLLSSGDRGAGEVRSACEAFCVDQYVDALKPVRQAALLKCMAARRIDEGVLTVLLGEEGAREIRPWLASSPLLIKANGTYHVAPPLRDSLLQLARARIGLAWEAAHETLFAYYRQRCELGSSTLRHLDPQWRLDKLETLYHELVGDDDDPHKLQDVLLSFLDGLQHFHPWAGAVALTWLDAVHTRALTPKPATSRRLAETTYSTWEALVDRRWDGALALVNELLASEPQATELLANRDLETPTLTDQTRERLSALRNLISSRLSLPPTRDTAADESTAVPDSAGAGPTRSASAKTKPVSDPQVRRAASPAGDPTMAVQLVVQADAASVTDTLSHELATGIPSVNPDSCDLTDPPEGSAASEEATDQAKAVELCSEANAYLSQKDYEVAIRRYDDALDLDPDYVAAYYNRGVAYNRLGALDGAIADFTRVLELDPHQAQAYRQRGLMYARKGDYARAIEDYNAALAATESLDGVKGPLAGAVLYDRANAYFHQKAYQQAIADYTAVLEHAPEHVETYLNRGLAHSANGDHPEALRDFNRALTLAPQHAPLYHHRGQVYMRTGRYTEALRDYDQALDLDPRYAAVHNNRGLLYTKIEAYGEAVEAYQRAMALQPDWATPYYNAACTAALMQDAEQACIWLARAIGLREAYRAMALRDPDLAPIRQNPQFQALVQAPD